MGRLICSIVDSGIRRGDVHHVRPDGCSFDVRIEAPWTRVCQQRSSVRTGRNLRETVCTRMSNVPVVCFGDICNVCARINVVIASFGEGPMISWFVLTLCTARHCRNVSLNACSLEHEEPLVLHFGGHVVVPHSPASETFHQVCCFMLQWPACMAGHVCVHVRESCM